MIQMKNTVVEKSTFDFLKKLAAHNNRDWFNANKHKYDAAKANIELFVDGLIAQMNKHDDIETPSARKSL